MWLSRASTELDGVGFSDVIKLIDIVNWDSEFEIFKPALRKETKQDKKLVI